MMLKGDVYVSGNYEYLMECERNQGKHELETALRDFKIYWSTPGFHLSFARIASSPALIIQPLVFWLAQFEKRMSGQLSLQLYLDKMVLKPNGIFKKSRAPQPVTPT